MLAPISFTLGIIVGHYFLWPYTLLGAGVGLVISQLLEHFKGEKK